MTRVPQLAQSLDQVLNLLDAKPTRCKGSDPFFLVVHAHCGAAPKETRKQGALLRAGVEQALQRVAAAELTDDGWKITRSISEAVFDVHGHQVTATIRHRSAELSFQYPPDTSVCLSPEARKGAVNAARSEYADLELPILVEQTPAQYPREARIEPQGGRVMLGFRIEATGEVSEVCVAMSEDQHIGYAFARAAAESVTKWRYKPARLNGEPVAMLATTVMSFSIGRDVPTPLNRRP